MRPQSLPAAARMRCAMHLPFWIRCVLATSAFFALAEGAAGQGPEFSWVPVDASAAFTTAQPDGQGQGTEIILPVGEAYIVEFELRVAGWGDVFYRPRLGTAQATIDATGLLGINADPFNPGINLVPLDDQAWRESPGGRGKMDGAFMATKTCHDSDMVDTGRVCASIGYNFWYPCLPGTTCAEKNDFVFSLNLAVGGVSTSAPNYVWGAVTYAGQCTTDTGGSYYLGTLVLNVPAAAVGTYTFGFDSRPSHTFLNDCLGSPIIGRLLFSGHVTLVPGACCNISERTCNDQVHPDDCAQPSIFHPGIPYCAELPDDDGDGTNDCYDACPFNPDYAFDSGPCNCSSSDADNDGTLDCLDACPDDPTKIAPGLCGCGIDDSADSDADMVPDCTDQCPGADDAIFAPECEAAIPTVTAWGLVVTALVLLIGGKVFFGRRSAMN